MWDKAKDFVQRAFTVIFIATLIIWFLQTSLNTLSRTVVQSFRLKECDDVARRKPLPFEQD